MAELTGIESLLEESVTDDLVALPLPANVCCLEYIYITGDLHDMKSKTRVVDKVPLSVEECGTWIFDGSASAQAPGADSECTLRPVFMCVDPFRRAPHKLVLCDALKHDGTPIASNTRAECVRLLNMRKDAEPWYGIEQECTIMQGDGRTPLGWPKQGYPAKASAYCAVGPHVMGRRILEALLRAGLYAGLKLSGINMEAMPGMIEWQVGPCVGVEAADQLWVTRYMLRRICEMMHLDVSFSPKPVTGFSGAGAHTNFSTRQMREDGGLEVIRAAVAKLATKHAEHIALYGEGNEERLTGDHDAPSLTEFTWGVASRAACVRIPRATERAGKGFLEDRRPAANMDPYQVCGKLFRTIVLE